MDVTEFWAGFLGVRCVVLSTTSGALVVDPGEGTCDPVLAEAARRGWAVRAVLVTHGHLDHTWDAGRLAAALDVPVVVPVADRYRFDEPFASLGLDVAALRAAGLDPTAWRAPDRLLTLDDPAVPALLDLGTDRVTHRPAPGHTEGSTVYLTRGPQDVPLAVVGDVLFAGGVGRTDLPGGDPAAMDRTLRDVVAHLDPATVVLPGHGPRTTLARELARNPYLVG